MAGKKAARPKTGAQRQAEFRATGLLVQVVIKDAAAIAALDRLTSELGSRRAAVEAALKRS